jgi:hypothetical protein
MKLKEAKAKALRFFIGYKIGIESLSSTLSTKRIQQLRL